MKALFLIQGHDVPSSRYRVLQFLPFWQEAGHEATVLEHEQALSNWKETLNVASSHDVVFIHRKRLSPTKIKSLRRFCSRLVYDVDDAVMYRDALKPGRAVSFLRRWRYGRLVQSVDQVIVGNRYIAKRTPVPESRLSILPTCLDTSRYGENRLEETDGHTLVWIGDSGSLHYLESLTPVLEEVGRRRPGTRLKIICDRFFNLENMEVIKIPWSAEQEVRELQQATLGLMPLKTDPWSSGKCALKFLQYLAVGRPAVVTPVGMNEDILSQSSCGLGAMNEQQWVESLLQLLENKTQRQTMGQQGFDLVRENYDTAKLAPRWIQLVSGLT